MVLSKRVLRLEQKNELQEPDILFMATIYEQREGPDVFGGAMAFATWQNGKHECFEAEGSETYDTFKQRVEGEVLQ